jgi:hypothetical protein
VIGIDGAVVVATRDAVLVTSMAEAQSVRDVVEALEPEGRGEAVAHRRVDRSWARAGARQSLTRINPVGRASP